MTISTFVCAACGHSAGDGGHCMCCPQCGGPKSASAMRCYTCAWPGRFPKSTAHPPLVDPAASAPSEPRRRRVRFRVYCFSCGRATEVAVVPTRTHRCDQCGGTMLVEVAEG